MDVLTEKAIKRNYGIFLSQRPENCEISAVEKIVQAVSHWSRNRRRGSKSLLAPPDSPSGTPPICLDSSEDFALNRDLYSSCKGNVFPTF